MRQRPHNRLVIGLMLLAAIATYADAPRMAGTLLIGSAANYVAARDGQAAGALQARLDRLPAGSAEAIRLSEQLDDGKRSVAIVEGMPSIPGVVAPHQCNPRLEPVSLPPTVGDALDALVVLRSSLLVASLAKPPPAWAGQLPACGPVMARRMSERGPPACA